MAEARDRAQPQHHLLVHIKDRDQEHQCPQQRGAVVLARLGVGTERAGVVVTDHDDQTRPEDRKQSREPVTQV
jgi:hypothetical protein